MPTQERIGLVLAGGGARGAYEAGALSIILPALEARGQSPRVLDGTSVGAITCAFVAANVHVGADGVADVALARWREVEAGRVMRSIIGRLPLTVLQYTGERLAIPGIRLRSLTDTAPLRATLDDWIDWGLIRANLADGRIDSAAVVATAASSGRSVAFTAGNPPAGDEKLCYVPTALANEHIAPPQPSRACFHRSAWTSRPSAWLIHRRRHATEHADQAGDRPGRRPRGGGRARLSGAARCRRRRSRARLRRLLLHLREGALVDPVVEDVRNLARINELVGEGGDSRYRPNRYILIAPERRNTGREACEGGVR